MTTQGKLTVKYREVRLQAKHSVRLSEPLQLSDPVTGGEYSTAVEWDHALTMARSGDSAVIQELRRALEAASECTVVLTGVETRPDVGGVVGQDHVATVAIDPVISGSEAYQTVHRKLKTAQGAFQALSNAARGVAHDHHEWLMQPRVRKSKSNIPLVDPRVPSMSETVQASCGAVHRASTARPHAPLAPDVARGRLLDSARNAGLINSDSRKKSRRGGKRKQLARLRAKSSAAESTTKEAIAKLKSHLQD